MGAAMRIIHIAIDIVARILAVACPRRTCQAPAAATNKAVARYAATVMCAKRYGKEGLKITFSQCTGITRPLTIANPCGVCNQLLEARIQLAEIRVPRATMIVAKKCSPGPTLFQPNSM